MKRNKREREHLDEVREQLYARTAPKRKRKRTKLRRTKAPDVPRAWEQQPTDEQKRAHARTEQQGVQQASAARAKQTATGLTEGVRALSVRMKIVTTALAFFFGAMLLSILVMLFGGNSISGENIVVSVDGPFTVGGGEVVPLTVTVANRNTVAIESATLIVEYPRGTQSANTEGRTLTSESIPLSQIRAGETVNVPIRARMFGEENEELQLRTAVEYRVSG